MSSHSLTVPEGYLLSLLVFVTCASIFLLAGGRLIRFLYKSVHLHRQIVWTVIPILIVFALVAMVTARVVNAVQNHVRSEDAVQATVIGHQFWWEIRYPSLGVVTANELHIPVSTKARPRETALRLESTDVVHSFWVPRLSGKADAIPNRINTLRIDPHEVGTYIGNCAEYCGTQHANMLIRVMVQSEEDFANWVAAQQQAPFSTTQLANEREAFLSLSCVNCHAVSGTRADGTFGPDLSHLMSRETLAGGMILNNPRNLRAFIKHPQRIKSGSHMPNMKLNDRELDQVVAYLSSLK